MIPDAFERRTLDYRCDDACGGVQYHIAHDNVHGSPKLSSREDAQIEEADRGLGQSDCELVQDLSCPECLRTKVRRLSEREGLLPLGVALPATPPERPLVGGWPPPCRLRERHLCTAEFDVCCRKVG